MTIISTFELFLSFLANLAASDTGGGVEFHRSYETEAHVEGCPRESFTNNVMDEMVVFFVLSVNARPLYFKRQEIRAEHLD